MVYGEIYNANTNMPFMPYGNLWSIGRKLLHNSLKPGAIGLFKDRVEAEATKLVCGVMNEPEKWSAGILRFVSSVVFCISYGKPSSVYFDLSFSFFDAWSLCKAQLRLQCRKKNRQPGLKRTCRAPKAHLLWHRAPPSWRFSDRKLPNPQVCT